MKSMGEKKRKQFDRAFKEDAVRLLMESGKPAAQVARELGIGSTTLTNWKRERLDQANVSGGSGDMTAAQMFEEIRRLQKELDYVKRQREILKKAVSILSDGSSSGMP